MNIRNVIIPITVDSEIDWNTLVRTVAPQTGATIPEEIADPAERSGEGEIVLVNFGESTPKVAHDESVKGHQAWQIAWGRECGMRTASHRETMSAGIADLETLLVTTPTASVLFGVDVTFGGLPFGSSFQLSNDGQRRLYKEVLFDGSYPGFCWFPFVRET